MTTKIQHLGKIGKNGTRLCIKFSSLLFLLTLLNNNILLSQDHNDRLLSDTISKVNLLLYQNYQYCFTNPKDSTKRVTYKPDTIPYLRYSTPSRLKYVQFEIDSMSKLSKKAKKKKDIVI